MKKRMFAVILVVALVLCMSLPVFASVEPVSIKESLNDAFSTVTNDMVDVFTGMLPVAMVVFGLTATAGFAIKWFKKLIGK